MNFIFMELRKLANSANRKKIQFAENPFHINRAKNLDPA